MSRGIACRATPGNRRAHRLAHASSSAVPQLPPDTDGVPRGFGVDSDVLSERPERGHDL